jgi:hypothetical protein
MKPSRPLPDFSRPETICVARQPEVLFTNNSVLLMLIGLLTGLFSGFALGVNATPTLLAVR